MTLWPAWLTALAPHGLQARWQDKNPKDPKAAWHQPLLTASDIAALAAQAQAWPPPLWPEDAHGQQAGDGPSARLGPGLDFEEIRPYQAGDDPRTISWRATARRGQLVVDVHREERQAVWHIVLDRRATMRLGTRRRLKVTQAARVAVLLAHAALEQGWAVGATLWDQHDEHLPPRHGEAALLPLIQALTAPCPPWSVAHHPTPPSTVGVADVAQRLHSVREAVAAGARVWWLTDAQGLEHPSRHAPSAALGALAALAALAQAVPLQVVWVQDPGEAQLPRVGPLRVQDPLSDQTTWWDTHDPNRQQQWAQQHAQTQAARAAVLRQAGLTPCLLSTTVDELWPVLSAQ
jgi:uncharacterized protein (DUF58 family)